MKRVLFTILALCVLCVGLQAQNTNTTDNKGVTSQGQLDTVRNTRVQNGPIPSNFVDQFGKTGQRPGLSPYGQRLNAIIKVTSSNIVNNSVAATTASIAATVSDSGDYALPIIERGVCYADTANPTLLTATKVAASISGKGFGNFSVSLSGLQPNTAYHARAYAVSLYDTVYGEDLTFTTLIAGTLSGKFSVNANGGTLKFSQGNLQYQASTNTWRFAEHQYDAVGSDNSNVSSSYSGWIDLFGWGTGNQPTQTSESSNVYPPFVDWGTNAISNGGNTANSWFTLSESGWTYLVFSRPNASSKRGWATVNGMYCYVLLPDEWELPSGLSFTPDANNWTNVYTAEQWAQMEAAGAVCLPIAGSRAGGDNNTNINDYNHWGCYWSSTSANNTQGYNLWITSDHVGTTDKGNYQMGASVRLMRNPLKQDAEGYYLIGSVQDWCDFATLVETMPTINAKMTADIATVTTMIGTEEHPYQGTFDGDGHKLTVNISCTTTQFVAPFHRVLGGSVKNLYVDGTVSSNQYHMSGLIGRATGSVSIDNCVVAVNIRMGTDYAGGFVGNGGSIQYHDESFVVMTDCLFMGTFTGVGSNKNNAAGFYGWGASTPAFINCLENGSFENINGRVPYLYEGTDGHNPTSSSNSYYKHGSMSLSWATNASNMSNADLVASLGSNWVIDPVINQPMLKLFADKAINYKLPGAFSVSSNKVVYFSKGNLQYQANTGTWRLAEHQYDFVGDATYGNVYENEVKCNNANISGSYSGWIDLFGWGTGNNPTNTSLSNSTYSTFVDWGVNAISNGGNIANQWRTLTNDEWGYLFSTRTNAANLRTLATVNGVTGLIVMPDGWNGDLTITFDSYSTNTLSRTQWESYEAAGCLFLPAAGHRYGTNIIGVTSYGNCWSSDSKDYNNGYDCVYGTNNLTPQNSGNKCDGRSIRLVSETPFLGIGTETNPYLISSEADWNNLAAQVSAGNTYSDKFFRQTADISVTTMVGLGESRPFSGTYDGGGKTLNLNLDATVRYTAPFLSIVNATIKNVVTTGTVHSTDNHASGLVGFTDGTCTIQNCLVNADVSGPQYLGGIVGHCWHANISIIGCVYTGTLNPASGQKTGGILGWGGDDGGHTIRISDCLFAGSLANTNTKFNPIGDLYDQNMYGPNTKILSNTYYTLAANISDEDNNSFVQGLDYKGKFARSITAGTGVTVSRTGAATEYDVSGIISYGTGILYGGVLYAGNGEAVSLTLSHAEAPTGFTFNQYTVTGGGSLNNPTSNSPTLTMTDANQTINVQWSELITYTAPTLRTGLTFNGNQNNVSGSAQNLVNAGSVSHGTIYYSTNGGSSWSTSVPTGTNAGTYTVHYKVVPDAGYSGGVGSTSLGSTTIAKANGWCTLSPTSSSGWGSISFMDVKIESFTVTHHGGELSFVKGGSQQDNISVGPNGNTYSLTCASQKKISSAVTITVTSAATTNYNAAEATYTCNP